MQKCGDRERKYPPLPKELEKAAFKWLFPTYHSRSQCDELAKASADFSSPYLWRKGQLWLWCQSLVCHFAVWHTLVTLCPLQHGHQVDFVIFMSRNDVLSGNTDVPCGLQQVRGVYLSERWVLTSGSRSWNPLGRKQKPGSTEHR